LSSTPTTSSGHSGLSNSPPATIHFPAELPTKCQVATVVCQTLRLPQTIFKKKPSNSTVSSCNSVCQTLHLPVSKKLFMQHIKILSLPQTSFNIMLHLFCCKV
jgi:hypothetical protein